MPKVYAIDGITSVVHPSAFVHPSKDLLADACATRAQSFGGEKVPARQVHAAFLAALNGFYAKVVNTHEL